MSAWRPMRPADIPAVAAISDTVHGTYTEHADIYAERLQLYPAGCWMLERAEEALGYLVSHPWQGDQPPALNVPILAILATVDRYYLHDLALLPRARGTGAAADAVQLVIDQADTAGFARITLTAVNGADAFWRKHGFLSVNKGAGYGEGSIAMERTISR
ncbi:GNAT family N-acetyltransferase [Sphingobium sp. AR-3-1]|uniref:GNAT family N-acetyltransferase n=1 Tax=Sphingobium psychrophilum TaxID=2728834 RepID=A0A7X9ZS49_9SPHN|nr:GNAT family N-acetyltransferase [Sphingobium psychrophilum]NML10192.1 GNAT family N-acetyltransferase [Sphingobium psychrophilum]